MAKIVLGIGASHTTLMNTQWDKVDHLPRAHAFRDGLSAASDALHAAEPDVVVVIGSNHFRGFWLDLMPAFTVGAGKIRSSGEHGTPAGELPSDSSFALDLCRGLIDRDIDIAFSDNLSVDHGISHAYQWVVGEDRPLPIVPIVVNCFAPPLPRLQRAADFGYVLRETIENLPNVSRVAVIATGGLSHQLPFPDWRAPSGDDEEFLARSWSEGRGDWKQFEARRREIVVNAPARTNPEFDRNFLALLERGHLSTLARDLGQDALLASAGNGGNEIRAWIMMAAALGNMPARTLAYSDMPEWLTGMAVALIEPQA